MLVDWIRDYERRRDVFSLSAHRALFDRFDGEKVELTSRDAIAAYPDLAATPGSQPTR
jgi:hypothetical protein